MNHEKKPGIAESAGELTGLIVKWTIVALVFLLCAWLLVKGAKIFFESI